MWQHGSWLMKNVSAQVKTTLTPTTTTNEPNIFPQIVSLMETWSCRSCTVGCKTGHSSNFCYINTIFDNKLSQTEALQHQEKSRRIIYWGNGKKISLFFDQDCKKYKLYIFCKYSDQTVKITWLRHKWYNIVDFSDQIEENIYYWRKEMICWINRLWLTRRLNFLPIRFCSSV